MVEVNSGDHHRLLSRRMGRMLSSQQRYNLNDDRIREVAGDAYHAVDNPNGVINLATAFSYLCEDLMSERLSDPRLYCWDLQGAWHMTTAHGSSDFRESLASFYSDRFEPGKQIDPNDLIVFNGVTSCLDYLVHCIADPGDVILVPVPAYAYLSRNINLRAEADFWPVDLWNCEDTVPFRLTANRIEAAIEDALNTGKVVRALLLVNPNNPLGDVYPPELISQILEVCHRHLIHAILDEIHALCVFDAGVRFRSAVCYDTVPNPDRTHVIWAMTKDFSFAGARISVLHTRSKLVSESLRRLAPFYVTPKMMQIVCRRILDDRSWCDTIYFPAFLDRLRMAHTWVTNRLTTMGVKVRPAVSGFVVMADFGPFLKDDTFQAEGDLFSHLLKAGVYVTPGYVMHCSKPGWARIVFSHPEHILVEGLNRIEKALASFAPP